MNNPYTDRLSPREKEEFASIVRDFEKVWRSPVDHSAANLAGLVERFPSEGTLHAAALAEVAVIDLAHRIGQGASVGPADYFAALPELAADEAAARYLIARDYRLRLQQATNRSADEHAAAFPRYDGPELRAALAAVEQSFREEAKASTGPWSTVRPGTDSSVPDSAAADVLPEVPGYELLQEVGEGGMGIVYRARQLALNRTVALKMISGAASRAELALFRKEAEASARLRHPHIVTVYEVGEHAPPGGPPRPYLAMEFLEGGSLARKLAGTPLPAVQAAELLETLARAVHHAHEAQVIHRDLKPGNVLLTADGIPKVADFGLAKIRDAAHSEEGRTPSGAVMGTPNYMAPEQASGRSRDVEPPADVYALGAILYECLTGRPPFTGPNATDVLLQAIADEPVPPRRLQPGAPLDLETICLKCLEKDPARRYPSAAALADDLRRWLDGKPISARPVGWTEKSWKWARRRPALAGLCVAVALLLLATIGGLFALWQGAEARQRARNAEVVARGEQLRNTLADFHARADGVLADVRLIRDAGGPDVPTRVLRLIGEAARLRMEAEQALAEGGEVPGVSSKEEQQRWDDRAAALRQEATRWLLRIRLERQRSIPLPEGPEREKIVVAVRADMKQVAVLYLGSTTLFLLGLDGAEQQRLAIPEEFARKVWKRNIEKRERFETGASNISLKVTSFRFHYRGLDRLEFQVGQEMISWSLPAGTAKQERRLSRHPTVGGASPRFGTHYLVHSPDDLFNTSVMVREWNPDTQPMVVWQPREASDAGERERRAWMTFGGDGRALFIRTDKRLYLIDAAGGGAAEVSLAGNELTKFSERAVPWSGGIATVEWPPGRKEANKPRLVFWGATLPQADLRALHHDAPPSSFEWGSDGLFISGSADSRVRAWRGRRQVWTAGIPYLRQENIREDPGRTRVPVGRVFQQDQTMTVSIREQGVVATRGWARLVSMPVDPSWAVYPTWTAPRPWPWWQFSTRGKQELIVMRRELQPNGGNQLRTELYDVVTGRLVHTFPAEGPGRILSHSASAPTTALAHGKDCRYAVTVTEEKDNRCTLQVWSVPEHRCLGSLGRYPLPFGLAQIPGLQSLDTLYTPRISPSPSGVLFTTAAGKDWLFVYRSLVNRLGARVELWRLPEVRLVRSFLVPGFPAFAGPLGDTGLVGLGGGTRHQPPVFFHVIDVETATRVCELERSDDAGQGDRSIVTATRTISAWRQAYPIDPYHVSAWNLTTGKRTDLDRKPWINGRTPQMIVSPSDDRLLIYGNLHENGMAHVELWDLTRLVLLREATAATSAIPWLTAVEGTYCTIDLPDFPNKGQRRQLHWRWSDGEELTAPPASSFRLLHEDLSQILSWQWLLQEAVGKPLDNGSRLFLQHGAGRRVPLEKTAALTVARVVYPGEQGRALVIEGNGGGVWDRNTGRQKVCFPTGHRFRCFDPTERWALTVHPARAELHLWDLKTGQLARRCAPREAAGESFDPLQAPMQLHPEGKRLAVLANGILRLWDLEGNRQVMSLLAPGHLSAVTAVAQHTGAGLVASAGGEGVIHLWARGDGAPLHGFLAHPAGVSVLAFHPNGDSLAAGSIAGEVSLHERSGRRRWSTRLPAPSTTITRLAFRSADSLLITTSDGRAILVEAKTGTVVRSQQLDSGLRSLSLSPDGSVAALGSQQGLVHLWDSDLTRMRRKWNTYSAVTALAFIGPDLLAAGGPSLRFWQASTGRSLWDVEVPGGARELRLNERTGALAVANEGDRILVLDLPDLYHRLEEMNLGFTAFPLERWPSKERSAPTLARAPQRWQDWYAWSESALRAKRWREAVWTSSQAIDSRPEERKPWVARGTAQARMGFASAWEEAVADFSEALARGDDWQVRQERAAVYARLGRWREAAADLDKAIELNAPGAQVRYERGLARSRLRLDTIALTDLDEALRLAPDHLDAARLRGEVLVRMGKVDQALAGLDRVVLGDRHSASAHTLRGMAHRLKKDYRAALEALDEAVRLDPDFSVAYRERGVIRFRLGDSQGAIADWTEAITLQPTNARLFLLRSEAFKALEDYPRAIEDLTEAIRLDPASDVHYQLRGYLHGLRGAHDRAITDFTIAIGIAPNNPVHYDNRGVAYLFKRDFRRAIEDFNVALRFAPANARLLRGRGAAHRGLGQLDRAIADYTRAIDVKSDDWQSWEGRGHAHAERGDWANAAADFEHVAAKSPGLPMAAYYRALALLGKGDRAAYARACAELLARAGKASNANAASLAVWTAALVPDAVEDARPYRRLIEKVVADNPKRYVFLYTAGATLYRAGQWEEARKKLMEARKQHVAGGTAFDCFLLAMTDARLGRINEAINWLDKGDQWIEWQNRDKRTTLPWSERLQLRLLRREAEQTIDKADKPKIDPAGAAVE